MFVSTLNNQEVKYMFQGPISQSVVSSIYDKGFVKPIPVQPHTFVESDLELLSNVIQLLLIEDGM